MIKSKYGSITNSKTGETKDIVVDILCLKNAKDFLIGGGIVLVGFSYLAISAFKNGARAFEQAEYDTLEALDLFKD